MTNLNDYASHDEITKQTNFSRIKEILCNIKTIETLSKQGGQPFLSVLANQLMLLTLAEENEVNNEQMDFLCSFLHRSIYKSLIPENFLDFDEKLEQDFVIFEAKNSRMTVLREILKIENVKNNDKICGFINEQLKTEKPIEKEPDNSSFFCHIF